MSQPRVSVLMSVYNCGPFVDEAVQCILNQTFTDFEFLITDDASDDDTWARLCAFTDPRVRLFRNTRNVGAAACKNAMLEEAAGEFVAIMDGDDACLPERFELQVRYLQEHPDCGAVGSHYVWMDEQGRDIRAFFLPLEDRTIREGLLYHCNTILHGASMIRMSALGEVGGYRSRIGITEDYDLWLRLRDVCAFGNVARVLYRYRQHSSQVGTARRAEQNAVALMARLYAVERMVSGEDSLDRYSDRDLADVRAGAVLLPRVGTACQQRTALLLLARVLRGARMPRQAAQIALKLICMWPFSPDGYLSLLRTASEPRSYWRPLKVVRDRAGRFLGRLLGTSSGTLGSAGEP